MVFYAFYYDPGMTPTNFQPVTILRRTPHSCLIVVIYAPLNAHLIAVFVHSERLKNTYMHNMVFVSLHETVLRNNRIKDWYNDE